MEELISSIVILVDTREKVNSHITDYFDRKEINSAYGDDSLVNSNGEHCGAIIIYGGKYNTLDNLIIKEEILDFFYFFFVTFVLFL